MPPVVPGRPHPAGLPHLPPGRRPGRWHLARLLVVTLLASLAVPVFVTPAQAHHQSLAFSPGGSFPTFGPNEVVEIIGGFHPYHDCPNLKNDAAPVVITYTDVYEA